MSLEKKWYLFYKDEDGATAHIDLEVQDETAALMEANYRYATLPEGCHSPRLVSVTALDGATKAIKKQYGFPQFSIVRDNISPISTLIDRGDYTYVNNSLRLDHLPNYDTGRQLVNEAVYCVPIPPDQESIDDLGVWLQKQNLRFASGRELLCFGYQFPGVQRLNSIVVRLDAKAFPPVLAVLCEDNPFLENPKGRKLLWLNNMEYVRKMPNPHVLAVPA